MYSDTSPHKVSEYSLRAASVEIISKCSQMKPAHHS